MKFPKLIRIWGLFILLFGLFAGLPAVVFIIFILKEPKFDDLNLGIFFSDVFLLSVFSGIIFIVGHRWCRLILFLLGLLFAAPGLILLGSILLTEISNPNRTKKDIIIFLGMGGIPVFLSLLNLLLGFYKPLTNWQKENAIKYSIREKISFIFLALFFSVGTHGIAYIGNENIYKKEEVEITGNDAGSSAGYKFSNAMDGKLPTFWEAFIPFGIGTKTTIRFAEDPISFLQIYPGDGSSDSAFKKYNRLKSGEIIYSDGKKFKFELKDAPEFQEVAIPEESHNQISITIESVYPGKENKTHIAEIKLLKKVKYFQ